jgi:hypothetical protein
MRAELGPSSCSLFRQWTMHRYIVGPDQQLIQFNLLRAAGFYLVGRQDIGQHAHVEAVRHIVANRPPTLPVSSTATARPFNSQPI